VFYTWAVYAPGGILEMGINPTTASVRKVALVDPGQRVGTNIPAGYAQATQVPGLPVIDVSEFAALSHEADPPVLREARLFGVSGDGRSVVIALNEVVVPDLCIRCDRAGFFVGSGFLCGFGFFDLTADEYALVGSEADRRQRLLEERR